MKDAHSSCNIRGDKSVDALYWRNFVCPVCPIGMDRDLISITTNQETHVKSKTYALKYDHHYDREVG